MPGDDRPLGGSEPDGHALQLFGTGKHSRGGKLGDVFDAFMLRHGHSGVYNDPIFNGADWVFDERLPDPGVVPLDIHMSAPDHGDLFLTLIRQGARSGLACDQGQLLEPIPAFGYPASLELTEWMVEDQKMIDRGERSDWQPGERLELHHKAWARGADIFMPALDDRARPICILDGAEPIVFKGAWGLLKDVAVFRSLLGLASIATAARVPRDGTTDRILLPIGTWYDGTMRIDFGRNLLFVPSYDQAKPWVPRFEDIRLLNRALHPEWEPVHEITEVGHGIGEGPPGRAARSRAESPRYLGNLKQKVEQACDELRRRDIAVGTATVYDELRGTGLDPNRETVRRYVSDYMETFEPN